MHFYSSDTYITQMMLFRHLYKGDAVFRHIYIDGSTSDTFILAISQHICILSASTTYFRAMAPFVSASLAGSA
jgi:hypothetical protein